MLRGQFSIVSVLGQGSFGAVFLAKDMSQGGQFRAIKQLDPNRDKSMKPEQHQAQWKQEVGTLSKLSHQGLPKIYEWFFWNQPVPSFYIVMEWVAGKALEDLIKERRASFTQEEVIYWGIEIADVLYFLHNQRPYPIVYGDLKPANIMITYDNHIKMIDFGVARFLNPNEKEKRQYTMVSPGFSPPEQYKSAFVDERSDIYSLGATMYSLMTGENLERYKFNIPPLSKVRRGVHPDFEAILEICLMTDPKVRYANVLEVRIALYNVYEELRNAMMQGQDPSSLTSLYEQQRRDRPF